MIKIIDYKAGNAPSVLRAVNSLGFEAELARRGEDLDGASRIILPGVGSAGATMVSLHDLGFIPALEDMVLAKKTPFLGVCVGMQILFEYSEEECARCLGWLKGRVVRFDDRAVRVPQMGWNEVKLSKSPCNPEMRGYYYFVNSYHAQPEDTTEVWGTADYGGEFTAAVNKGNIYATQFHIEKSGEAGLSLLRRFLSC